MLVHGCFFFWTGIEWCHGKAQWAEVCNVMVTIKGENQYGSGEKISEAGVWWQVVFGFWFGKGEVVYGGCVVGVWLVQQCTASMCVV